MKTSKDFKRTALEALKNRWGAGILAGFLAALVGAIDATFPQIEISFENGAFGLEMFGVPLYSTGVPTGFITGALSTVILAALVSLAVVLVVGSVVQVGYARFNMELLDQPEKPKMNILFSYFPHWKNAVLTNLLTAVYVFLWTLLLIVPGIMAAYSYAMAGYILADNPEMTADQVLSRSKQIMQGNRWRLFCLHISFIGWDILCLLSGTIGNLVLNPYKQVAITAFYRDVNQQATTVEF